VDDEDELAEDLAERWNVDIDDVYDLADRWGFDSLDDLDEATEDFGGIWDVPDDDGIPDPDYMMDLADSLDVDVSDLYDMYYGYEPD
jgi:hypothetical protein